MFSPRFWVRVVAKMTKNWFRWLFNLVFLFSAGLVVFQFFLAWKAIQAGESPVNAARSSQQQTWHIVLNPWVFTIYLLVLFVLLWSTVRAIVRKQHHSNDFWLAAMFLVAITV